MNLDAVVTKGRLPWKPCPDVSDLAVWHQYEHPLSGTFTTKAGTVLFAVVDGVESDVSVWAYACLERDEAQELVDVTFESREDLRDFVDATLSSHRLVLALASDLLITEWSVADRIGPIYEVTADFLKHVLAERLRHKDPRAKVHAQLAWVSASTPEHVDA
ncbi:MAG: hypothetical protein ACRDNW_16795 [Trebonia sp.]